MRVQVRGMEKTADKTIITVVGKDTVGIIAKVCTYLANNSINVLDISQTILNNKFTMVMAVDAGAANVSFDKLSEALKALGDDMELSIRIQREEIFDAMHRI